MNPLIMTLCRLALTSILMLAGHAGAQGSEPGGFVTQSQGDVTYQAGTAKEQALPAFARLASGTRIRLGDNAKVQVVYLRGGRQESWFGKAVLEIGETGSKVVGKDAPTPVIKQLQPFMVETLLKSGDVMGSIHARQGLIRVRLLMTASRVKEAEDRYAELRLQSADDDITPEIYLLTTLDGLKAFQSMKKPLGEMLRRQPGNAEAVALHDHFMMLLNTGTVEMPAADPAGR